MNTINGIATGSASLQASASAFEISTPIDFTTVDGNPFYAVNRFQFIVPPDFNPSSTYDFTRRFRISAIASASLAQMRDLIWFPIIRLRSGPTFSSAELTSSSFGLIKIKASANSSASLTFIVNGVVTGIPGVAISVAELEGNALGDVTTFANAVGNLQLTVSGSARVSLLRATASGSAQLTSSADANSTAQGVANGIAILEGESEGLVTSFGISDGSSILEGEAVASVSVSANAEGEMMLEGISEATSIINASADSVATLTSNLDTADIIQNASAVANSTLNGVSNGVLTRQPGEALGSASLNGDCDGILIKQPGNVLALITLTGLANGQINNIPATASSFANLITSADANVIVPPLVEPSDWEESVDILGYSVGLYSIPSSGTPPPSQAGTAFFSLTNLGANSSQQANNFNNNSNQSTGPLTAAGIGASRINRALRMNNNMRMTMFDGSQSNFILLNSPVHFRWIVNMLFTANGSLNLWNVASNSPFLNWALNFRFGRDATGVNARSVMSHRPNNGVNFTNENSFSTAYSSTPVGLNDWMLLDVVLRPGPGDVMSHEVMINGGNNVTFASNTFTNKRLEIGNQRITGTASSAATDFVFFGYRQQDFTLVDHNADRAILGL